MKKTEKKLINAIHDATIEGRLKWSLVGNEFRADLPLKDLMGIAEYVAIMQHDDMYTIYIEGKTFEYAIHASGRKMRKKIGEIFSYALLSDINPQAILNDITKALLSNSPPHHSAFAGQCPCYIEICQVNLCE